MKKKLTDIFTRETFNTLWSLVVTTLVKTSGLTGKIATLVLKYGGQYLYDFIMNLIRKAERKQEQDAKKEVLDEVLQDPNSTAKDAGKAYEDYINSGRSGPAK